VKAGSYDPTLVDVELTAEEAKTRANRRDAFREHLRATLAEKELVGAFAKMYRMNAIRGSIYDARRRRRRRIAQSC